jgi:phage shock protein E
LTGSRSRRSRRADRRRPAYDQVAARSSDLPTDKSAKIVAYCRSGNESAIAAQTLVDLGYTNIDNLDGGMNAWTASGRSLVQLNRG